MLPSDDCMKDCTVEQLRDIKRTANLRSSSMDKTNDKLKYYNIVKVFLEEEERKHPIDEQFPFVRIDMDVFDRQLDKMLKSMTQLHKETLNFSTQMELAVRKLFGAYLDSNGWDYWDVPLTGGKIYRKKGDSLVQWDSIIGARKDDDFRLFLVETKTIPHQNDIFCEKGDEGYDTILERGKRTIEYTKSLRSKNMKGLNGALRTQDNLLLEFVEAKIVFVYASGIMHDDIKDRIKRLPAMFKEDEYSVDVCFMECHTATEGSFGM